MKRLKNIYFVQTGMLYGDNAYLPYTAGCVAAYAMHNPVIRESYRLGHFTFLRAPVAQVVASFEEPFLVAFSNYVWNFEYHKALARAVKERWPGCRILFGGHQVLNGSSRQLEEYPFVDFLIRGAGEIPFEKLLLALHRGDDLGEVPSLSYRDADGLPLRTEEAACESCDFPSPYLAGIFDAMLAEHPQILFSMIIETNRGCPYRCAFCDWGTVRHGILRTPMERIKAEIDWAARHKIEYVLAADANFGILERDDAIVDYVIESKRRTGYPQKFNTNFAKNSTETEFRLNQKLSAHGLNNGATLSFQSVSPAVLEAIGRKNLDLERFRELVSLYNQAGVPVYSELILGLPGETLESFANGIGTLLAMGMHGALEIYHCALLPNAELARPAFMEEHGIKSISLRQYHKYGSPENQDEIPEYSDIVYQTNAMPVRDWVTASLFANAVQGFHGLGLLPYLAVYLYWENQLPYERFYFDLMDYAKENPSTLAGELLLSCEKRCGELAEGKGESAIYCDSRFGEVMWPLGAALFLRAAYEADRFYAELPSFLRRYSLDAEVLAELIRFQRAMLYLPVSAPTPQAFAYDFPGYFDAAFAGQRPVLQKRRATMRFPGAPEKTWVDFAREYVWYGRRKLTRKEYEVQYD